VDLMEQLAPLGKVYQAGTLSGNPVAVAAGRATLDLLDASAYAALTDRADYLASGMSAALSAAGRTAAVARAGTLMSVFLGLTLPPKTFDEAMRQDSAAYAQLFHAWRQAGVYAPPSSFEVLFVSLAHSHADLDAVVNAASTWANV